MGGVLLSMAITSHTDGAVRHHRRCSRSVKTTADIAAPAQRIERMQSASIWPKNYQGVVAMTCAIMWLPM